MTNSQNVSALRTGKAGDEIRLTRKEISRLVYNWIGVQGGYLGSFQLCEPRSVLAGGVHTSVSTDAFPGTTRECFEATLFEAPAKDQAAVLRAILEDYPRLETPDSRRLQFRTDKLHPEIRAWIVRLETGTTSVEVGLLTASETVRRALDGSRPVSQWGGHCRLGSSSRRLQRGAMRGWLHRDQRRDGVADTRAGDRSLARAGNDVWLHDSGAGTVVRTGRAVAVGLEAGRGVHRPGPATVSPGRRSVGVAGGGQLAGSGALRRLQLLCLRLPDGRQAVDVGVLPSPSHDVRRRTVRELSGRAHHDAREEGCRGRGVGVGRRARAPWLLCRRCKGGRGRVRSDPHPGVADSIGRAISLRTDRPWTRCAPWRPGDGGVR